MIHNNKKPTVQSLYQLGIFLFLSIFFQNTYAALDSWSLSSPTGGAIQALAVDPTTADTVFAGTAANGIYKSTDGGATWVHSSSGLDFLDVQTIAIDPADTTRIYAGTNGGGIFRSIDGGDTWEAINEARNPASNNDLINLNVYSISFDPNNTTRMFAGTFGNAYVSTSREADAVIWDAQGIGRGLTYNAVYAIASDPANSGEHYVGTFSGGAFGSSDAFISWANINSGLTTLNVRSMLFSTTGDLLAGTQEGGFFIGTVTNPSNVNWVASNAGLASEATINAIAQSATNSNVLYLATHNNVYRSSDGGATWGTVGAALSGLRILSLAIDYNTAPSETIYVGTPQGVYKVSDGDTAWAQVNTGIHAHQITDIAITQNSNTFYAATLGSGVLRTTDGGGSWAYVNTGLIDLKINSITLDGSNIYAGTQMEGVFRSTNDGASWSATSSLGTDTAFHIADDNASSDVLYAGTPNGISTTTDGGANWAEINGDIANNHDVKVQSLTIDNVTTTNRRLYISTASSGVFYSDITTIDWINISLGLDNEFVYAVAIDPNDPDVLYAGTRGSGVYKSIDRGASWAAVNTGIRATAQDIIHVNAIAVDPNNSAVVYVGTETRGVFRTGNGGDSWVAANDALDNLNINTLAVNPDTSTLYAGTHGSGLFEIDFSSPSNTASLATTSSTAPSGGSGGSGNSDYLFILCLFGVLYIMRRRSNTIFT